MNTALKALIVDDEFHARENLRMLLDDFCPEIEVVATANGVNDALQKVAEYQPQVVFLDIRMPSGAEGFDFLDRSENLNFQVVFVTAFKDYAVQAFNANAIHYVLKPIDVDDLMTAVNKLVEYQHTFRNTEGSQPTYLESLRELTKSLRANQRPRKVTIYHSKGFRIVDDAEIVHVESEGTCSRFYLKDGTSLLDTKNLKVYEDLLNPEVFFRVHRSHIINLNELKEYINTEGSFAILSDGSSIPIARAKLSTFLSTIKQL